MFGWFKSQPNAAPAGYRVTCTARLPHAEPGQPAGFRVDVDIRKGDEDDAVSRAISYLYAEGAADVRVDAISPLNASDMAFHGDEAEASGRIYFAAGEDP